MNVIQSSRHAIVSLASLGLLIPQVAFAAPPNSTRPTDPPLALGASQAGLVLDVALDDGGVLRGQVVDPQGRPLPGISVYVRQQQRQVATALTDSNGNFELGGLQGGIYQVEAAQSHATCRLWAARTAPPAAQRAAMIVAAGNTVRGQIDARRYFWPALIVTGVVGAAIAIPIAVNNSNNDGS